MKHPRLHIHSTTHVNQAVVLTCVPGPSDCFLALMQRLMLNSTVTTAATIPSSINTITLTRVSADTTSCWLVNWMWEHSLPQSLALFTGADEGEASPDAKHPTVEAVA